MKLFQFRSSQSVTSCVWTQTVAIPADKVAIELKTAKAYGKEKEEVRIRIIGTEKSYPSNEDYGALFLRLEEALKSE